MPVSILTPSDCRTAALHRVFPSLTHSQIRSLSRELSEKEDPILYLRRLQAINEYEGIPIDREELDEIRRSAYIYTVDPEISSSTRDHIFWPNPDKYKDFDLKSSKPYRKAKKILFPDTSIVSIGSCFAREIGHRLLSKGYNYIYTQRSLPLGVRDNNQNHPLPLFSAYYGVHFNSLSLLYLTRRAQLDQTLPKYLVPWTQGPGDVLIDPFREGLSFASEGAYLQEYDTHTNALLEAFTEAGIIIWTFGLSEAWVFRDDPDLAVSYGFQSFLTPLLKRRVLTVEDHVSSFIVFYNLIKSLNPSCQIVMTLSPIPLNATFLHEKYHVIQANEISKSAIRIAIEAILEQTTGDVHYFPSYELVTKSAAQPWASDQRHVNTQTLKAVIDLFIEMYS